MTLDQYMGPFPPPPDHSKPTKRGPYKRGPKSAESSPVVGVYEAQSKPPHTNGQQYVDELNLALDAVRGGDGYAEKVLLRGASIMAKNGLCPNMVFENGKFRLA